MKKYSFSLVLVLFILNLYGQNFNNSLEYLYPDTSYFYFASGKIDCIIFYDSLNYCSKKKKIYYYENGNKKKEICSSCKIIDAETTSTYHDSIYTEWYENGFMKYKYQLKNFEKNGYYIEWYDNGQVFLIANKIDGKTDGKYYTFYKKGNLSGINEKKYGKYVGEQISYFESGKLSSYGDLGDEGNGIVKNYTEDGELYLEEIFENGRLVKSIHYSYPESIYNKKD